MMVYQTERRRTWAVYILFFLALLAAVLAFVDAARYMGWIPVQATIPGLGEISFVNPSANWVGAAMAGLLGVIWLIVASWLWTLNPSGWLFVIIIATINLIFQVLAILGGTAFSQVLPAVAINGLALILALLPGTRDAFMPRRNTAVIEPDQAAAVTAAAAFTAAKATAHGPAVVRVPEAPLAVDETEFEAAVEAAETDSPPLEETPAAPSRMIPQKPAAVPAASEMELTIIEGIGPKISAALKAAGINSIYKLSAVSAEELRGILRDAGLSADPTTWPEQARMAAAGDLSGLKAYQAALIGGREV